MTGKCSGAKWRDLPERYGLWSTFMSGFRKWRDNGMFDAILARLHFNLREDGLMDLDAWMIRHQYMPSMFPQEAAKKAGLKNP